MRILAISGSLRRDSHNSKLLRAAAASPPPGVELELLDPDALRHLPLYDEDLEHEPPHAVLELRERVRAADGLLFATPEYNGSIPGGLKNAVDWLSRPRATAALKGKDAAVIGASTGMFGAVWAQADLRRALSTAGARVVDRELPIPAAHEAFTAEGSLSERELVDQLDEHLNELIEAIAATEEIRAAA